MAQISYLGAQHMANGQAFEPLRTNNFEVQITGLRNGESVTLSVDTFKAPNISQEVITVPYGNSKVKFAGTPTFNDSSISCNDFVGLDVERILSDWQKLAYNYGTEEIGYAKEYKKEGYLIEYDTKGKVVRQWRLIGCWLSSLDIGSFNQAGNEVHKVECTLVYDFAIPA